LKILFWGLLSGRRCWRTLCVHGFFHLFEIDNLGELFIIMSILTIKSIREVSSEVIVLLLSWLIVIVSPLGVMVALILVPPDEIVFLGVISIGSQVVIVSVFPFLLGIIQRMGWIFHIQFLKSMKLLNARGLNKVNVDVWLSQWRRKWLWRTTKMEIWIVVWIQSIWFVGI
jgi:hypothetical protein